jgi:phage tail sheath protein FI
MVFEPNNAALRADVRYLLESYLRQLYRVDAFRGATENSAFFVRCDDELNSQRVLDAGQLIVEVGVAPAEPLEFIVLRIARGGDGTLRAEG